MHSILSNVKSSSSTSSSRQLSSCKQTTASISDSQIGANVNLRQMSANHQVCMTLACNAVSIQLLMPFFIWNQQVEEPYQFKAASFASINLHVEVANDVSSASKTLYNQHELQQLSTTIGGKLIVVNILSWFHPRYHFDSFWYKWTKKTDKGKHFEGGKTLRRYYTCVCVCMCVEWLHYSGQSRHAPE